MNRRAREPRDRGLQRVQAVVQRQQRVAADGQAHRLLLRAEGRGVLTWASAASASPRGPCAASLVQSRNEGRTACVVKPPRFMGVRSAVNTMSDATFAWPALSRRADGNTRLPSKARHPAQHGERLRGRRHAVGQPALHPFSRLRPASSLEVDLAPARAPRASPGRAAARMMNSRQRVVVLGPPLDHGRRLAEAVDRVLVRVVPRALGPVDHHGDALAQAARRLVRVGPDGGQHLEHVRGRDRVDGPVAKGRLCVGPHARQPGGGVPVAAPGGQELGVDPLGRLPERQGLALADRVRVAAHARDVRTALAFSRASATGTSQAPARPRPRRRPRTTVRRIHDVAPVALSVGSAGAACPAGGRGTRRPRLAPDRGGSQSAGRARRAVGRPQTNFGMGPRCGVGSPSATSVRST